MKLLKLIPFLFVMSLQLAQAQEFLKNKDLSDFKTEEVSDAQLLQISQELKNNQTSLEQVEPLLLAKGMSKEEFIKFKARLQGLTLSYIDDGKEQPKESKEDPKQNTVKLAKKKNAVYGSELFTSRSLSFEPNQNIPTPTNYILGPGDKLELLLHGVQQFTFSGTISKNGTLAIPNVGDVLVSGLTFDAAKAKLRKEIGRIYTTILSNSSKLSVSVSNYRSIMVTIIGAQQSGNYRLSAMTTIFNALHVAGGPSDIGSYRKIELIRNNKVIRIIDLYQFLTKGDQSDNVSLEDNDVIRIPSYEARVVLEGEIKNPGIFEVVAHDKLGAIISYASGFTEDAYKNRILVKQKTTSELKVRDLNEATYADYLVQAGDVITVDKILDRYENRVQIKGAVYRPGAYSLQPNEVLTVKELIQKADGLKENVFLPKASLIRQQEDLTKVYLNIDLQAVMKGDSEANLPLQKEDLLVVFYNQVLLDSYKVSIDGEVRAPGTYDFAKGKSLYDLLLEADYFTDKAASKVTVYRNKVSADFIPNDREKIVSFELKIDPNNPETATTFLLEPMDQVVVRRIVTFETPQMVSLHGEILYPGAYAMVKKEERVSDLIERSGGFKEEADINAIRIIRKVAIERKDLSKSKAVKKLTEEQEPSKDKFKTLEEEEELRVKDSLLAKRKIINEVTIPIDWKLIQRNKKSTANIMLEPADSIVVPKKKQTVLITGSVMFDTEVAYKKGKPLNYYLKNAGGVNDKGWARKVYVVNANGSASSSSSFLMFKSYPKVQPGSKIIVPEKPERKGNTTGEIVGIASVLASLTGVLLAVFR